MTLLVLAQVLLGSALMGTCFCRLVKTNERTVREIRWAIWFLFVSAGLVVAAPIMPMLDSWCTWHPLTTPHWVWLALLAAIVTVQVATRKHWRSGPPDCYQKG